MRRLALAASCLMALSAGAAERRDVVVWGMSYGPGTQGLEAQIRVFEERNPDLRVRLLSMGAGRMNPQKLMTAIVGRVPPDVVHQDRFTIADWSSRGAFMPLDGFIARDRDTDPMCPTPEKYYPAPWQEVVYKGQVFAIPDASDNRALYWNRAIFREQAADLRAAGLDPTRAPGTWSELLAYSRVLTQFNPDGTLQRAGFIPLFGHAGFYLWSMQNEGRLLTPDGRRCTLDSAENLEALATLEGLYKVLGGIDNSRKFEASFRGEASDPFLSGKIAMKLALDVDLYGMVKWNPGLDFGAAPPPVPDDRFYGRGRFAGVKDKFITWVGGFSYAIPAGARNADGAWRFVKWIASPEARVLSMRVHRDLERSRGRLLIPRIQANREANEIALRDFRPPIPAYAAAQRLHKELMDVARVRQPTFAGQLLWDQTHRAVNDALAGSLPTKEAMARARQAVQRELDAEFGKERYPQVDLRVPAVLGAAAAVFGVAVLAASYRRGRGGRLARHEALRGYLFVAPWLVGFLAFTLGPIVASLFFSFTQYNVLTEARWVGAKNFVDLFTTEREFFFKSLANVAYLGGVGVPLGLASGLAVAMLLNAAVRGMRFYRTMFYLPVIVPGVASAVLWAFILAPDPNRGLLNSLWNQTITPWFGVIPPGWLSAEPWAKPALLLMGLWGAGGGMILWLAALKGVPASLYEAAAIDGATPTQQFWTVTLPQLSPIVFFNVVIGLMGSLQEFDRIYIMVASEGGGSAGPGDSLLTPVYHLFVNGFSYFRMGYASALAWVIFAIVLAMTWVQFRLAPRWVHYEGER